jgi:hypothetical protein
MSPRPRIRPAAGLLVASLLGILLGILLGVALPASPVRASIARPGPAPSGAVRITSPAAGQVFPPGWVPVAGTAKGTRRIDHVEVAMQDLRTGLWWHPDGTWGARRWSPATLTGGPAREVAWTFRWEGAPAGRFAVRARASQAGDATLRAGGARSFVVSARASRSYLTILLSRTQWTTAPACRDLPGAPTLEDVATALAARGLRATGSVVIDRASETDQPTCVGQARSATWAQIAQLRDRFGWSFVSAGLAYRDLTTLPPEEQRRESCGSLEALADHGHPRAWGLFAYPDNRWDATIQQRVVARCFAFGRRYGPGLTQVTANRAPWFQSTYSVNGGVCATAGASCADPSVVGTTYAYAPPAVVARALVPAPGRWNTVQFYRFVTGARVGRPAWDCTDPDPDRHWTSAPELYCLEDLMAILDALPPVTTVDPVTVARTWGRVPAGRRS